MVTAYCVKCRKKVEMKNPKKVTLKNGRPAAKGICPNCGTNVFRIGKVELYATFSFSTPNPYRVPPYIFLIDKS